MLRLLSTQAVLECSKSGGGFQPPHSGWKPLPLWAAALRQGHTAAKSEILSGRNLGIEES